MENKEWFATWFDSKYYHVLYQNRDDAEAERFIRNLLDALNLEKDAKVLDLACGKGRHAITLHNHGFNVLGVDLSGESIEYASHYKEDGLDFQVHDMRFPIDDKKFDAVFNLFTSFGYFESKNDNAKVIQSIHDMLSADGILVIDFMNVIRVINNLVAEEQKTINDIEFKINRSYNGTHIKKEINIIDGDESYAFEEKVQALKTSDFTALLNSHGFEIIRTFGDFDLGHFDENNSDRLIIIARKKE